jgi:hypothetical protein
MSDYMGSSDDARRDWMVNFRDQADPAAYLVTPADVGH